MFETTTLWSLDTHLIVLKPSKGWMWCALQGWRRTRSKLLMSSRLCIGPELQKQILPLSLARHIATHSQKRPSKQPSESPEYGLSITWWSWKNRWNLVRQHQPEVPLWSHTQAQSTRLWWVSRLTNQLPLTSHPAMPDCLHPMDICCHLLHRITPPSHLSQLKPETSARSGDWSCIAISWDTIKTDVDDGVWAQGHPICLVSCVAC